MRYLCLLIGPLVFSLLPRRPDSTAGGSPPHRYRCVYFGTAVHDPYRWMENLEDPATLRLDEGSKRVRTSGFREPSGSCRLLKRTHRHKCRCRHGWAPFRLPARECFFAGWLLATKRSSWSYTIHARELAESSSIQTRKSAANVNANLNMYTPDSGAARESRYRSRAGGRKTRRCVWLTWPQAKHSPTGSTGHALRFLHGLPYSSGFFYTRLPKLATATLKRSE